MTRAEVVRAAEQWAAEEQAAVGLVAAARAVAGLAAAAAEQAAVGLVAAARAAVRVAVRVAAGLAALGLAAAE